MFLIKVHELVLKMNVENMHGEKTKKDDNVDKNKNTSFIYQHTI